MRRSIAAGCLAVVLATPGTLGVEYFRPSAPPPNPRTVAIERAVHAVDMYLAPRMPLMDDGRRIQLARTIVHESVDKQFDPLFVLAVIEVESNYDHEAVSPTGAKGLMQVIPSTWNLVTERYGLGRLEKFNPVNSVRVGICYLHLLVTSGFKRPDTMLLAYNQGPGTANDIIKGNAEPNEEAQAYGPRIIAVYKRLLREHGINAKDVRKLYRNPFGSLVSL